MSRNYIKGYNTSRKSSLIKTRSRRNFFLKIAITLVLFAAIYGILHFLFVTDLFKIKNIVISGNEKIASAAIIEELGSILSHKKFIFLKNNNFYLADEDEIENGIKEKFPRIDEVKIKKDFPNSLAIDVEEKNAEEILCQGYDFSKCFFIDKKGIAFDHAADSQGFLILKIVDSRDKEIVIGSKVLEEDFMEFANSLRNNFKNLIGKNIKLLILEHPAQREIVALVNDWKAIFDISLDAKKQLIVLREVLAKEIKNKEKDLEYIDLRVEGRAYYKLKNQ